MAELQHHGIIGMKWGVRRYQNADGSLTEEGKRRRDEKDARWAHKNYDKIYKQTYKNVKKDMDRYVKKELNRDLKMTTKSGKLSFDYANAYNQKLAELMNTKIKDIRAPSGKVVQFVAKRGEMGVHMALADAGYDLSQLKNGIYSSGRIAYKQKSVGTA